MGERKAKSKIEWKSAPPALIDRFTGALRDFPQAEVRKMFGYPAAFVNGNMMAGLFQDSMMLRLSAADLAAMREQTGARPFEPMPGRVMREYVVVPPAILKSNAGLERWLGYAFAYVSSLPRKSAKPRRQKKGGRVA